MKVMKRTEPMPEMRSRLNELFDVDRFFPTDWFKPKWMENVPSANIMQMDDKFMIELAVPGMEKKDFTVKVEDGCLVINCEKKEETEKEMEMYTRREYNFRSFTRTFELPETVKFDDINAIYTNGILRITLPKFEVKQNKPVKQIAIK